MNPAMYAITDLRSCLAVARALGLKEVEISALPDWQPLWRKLRYREIKQAKIEYRKIIRCYGEVEMLGIVHEDIFIY